VLGAAAASRGEKDSAHAMASLLLESGKARLSAVLKKKSLDLALKDLKELKWEDHEVKQGSVELVLSANALAALPDDIGTKLPQLETLRLDKNRFSDFPITALVRPTYYIFTYFFFWCSKESLRGTEASRVRRLSAYFPRPSLAFEAQGALN